MAQKMFYLLHLLWTPTYSLSTTQNIVFICSRHPTPRSKFYRLEKYTAQKWSIFFHSLSTSTTYSTSFFHSLSLSLCLPYSASVTYNHNITIIITHIFSFFFFFIFFIFFSVLVHALRDSFLARFFTNTRPVIRLHQVE